MHTKTRSVSYLYFLSPSEVPPTEEMALHIDNVSTTRRWNDDLERLFYPRWYPWSTIITNTATPYPNRKPTHNENPRTSAVHSVFSRRSPALVNLFKENAFRAREDQAGMLALLKIRISLFRLKSSNISHEAYCSQTPGSATVPL